MKRTLLLLFTLTIQISCIHRTIDNQDKSMIKNGNIEYTIDSLQGFWSVSDDENISFIIKNDSIYFFDHLNTPLPIRVNDDSLIIHYGSFVSSDKIIHASSNELILVNFENDTATYYNKSQ